MRKPHTPSGIVDMLIHKMRAEYANKIVFAKREYYQAIAVSPRDAHKAIKTIKNLRPLLEAGGFPTEEAIRGLRRNRLRYRKMCLSIHRKRYLTRQFLPTIIFTGLAELDNRPKNICLESAPQGTTSLSPFPYVQYFPDRELWTFLK